MKHWPNPYESNLASARYILAHPENETLHCLRETKVRRHA